MKKIYSVVLAIIIVIGFTSCEEDYWETTTFDYEMPYVDWDGNFEISSTIYLRDLNIGHRTSDIIEIETLNSWIELDGDLRVGDLIRLYDITINGETLRLNYRASIGPRPDDDRFFTNDRAYKDFIYQAMKLLNRNGRIDVIIRGYSDMSVGRLYVVLGNNLDVRLRD
ncbi:hypothetical protein D0T53_03235 [Dysgonomonas sp. 216]|uniref:hypothetical protein n=1 Tax=Dysgonomonas sp. 216 TaxID=2302934 RepID=UPI0013D4803E|nr:hypothetical protein [Dysgonomonas sp. 216]NDW17930.1 hypothetical protein [Dysgonomonas sp. 216]